MTTSFYVQLKDNWKDVSNRHYAWIWVKEGTNPKCKTGYLWNIRWKFQNHFLVITEKWSPSESNIKKSHQQFNCGLLNGNQAKNDDFSGLPLCSGAEWIFAKQVMRLTLYYGTAYEVKDYVLFTNLESRAQNPFTVTQLLGSVGIHLLVYLIIKALTLSTILGFDSNHGSPKYKKRTCIIVQDEFQLSAYLFR